jgi:glycosyltransferase involved in cell wall biosynthesis
MAQAVAVRQTVTELPFLSVVIPTHNRAEVLARCLASLASQDYPTDRWELLVVDAASCDDTRERVEECGRACGDLLINYLRLASWDANAARNAGIREARGELIALIDDDVLVPGRWASALVAGAERWPDGDCFGGPVRPIFEGATPSTCSEHPLAGTAFDEGTRDKPVAEVWGGNMALRPRALIRAGFFKEGLRVHQEWEWERRLRVAGGEIVYLPDAWLWHIRVAHDLSLVATMREYFARGRFRGALDETVTATYAARRTLSWARHAATDRCVRGLTEAARSLGLLCGVATRVARRASRGLSQ